MATCWRQGHVLCGTGNKNTQGVGIVLELDRAATSVSENAFPSAIPLAAGEMLAVPVTSLYNHGLQMKASDLLKNRTPGQHLCSTPRILPPCTFPVEAISACKWEHTLTLARQRSVSMFHRVWCWCAAKWVFRWWILQQCAWQ